MSAERCLGGSRPQQRMSIFVYEIRVGSLYQQHFDYVDVAFFDCNKKCHTIKKQCFFMVDYNWPCTDNTPQHFQILFDDSLMQRSFTDWQPSNVNWFLSMTYGFTYLHSSILDFDEFMVGIFSGSTLV